ncbi:MAG: DNA polymerase III, partial [Methanobacterium sp.]|nr:DNA polymerase III [Methanobacterium sp.]
FIGMGMVDDVVVSGPLKTTVHLKEDNINVDLRVFDDESFGSALLYFTGSKETNIALRRIAINKKLKLSEYGVFKDQKLIAGTREEDVFKSLGMEYIEPELRENTGEVEAAILGELPKILGYNDIIGDLQTHTKWSDGSGSIIDMAQEARKWGMNM